MNLNFIVVSASPNPGARGGANHGKLRRRHPPCGNLAARPTNDLPSRTGKEGRRKKKGTRIFRSWNANPLPFLAGENAKRKPENKTPCRPLRKKSGKSGLAAELDIPTRKISSGRKGDGGMCLFTEYSGRLLCSPLRPPAEARMHQGASLLFSIFLPLFFFFTIASSISFHCIFLLVFLLNRVSWFVHVHYITLYDTDSGTGRGTVPAQQKVTAGQSWENGRE